ncbi:zinc finger protein basonuclin-2 [Maylandia zebra]|uniref:zinc finger protein basonuclin-2 n=1 Tax=Maylandia zebra TaxID=106582 RepID=UPI00403CB7D0
MTPDPEESIRCTLSCCSCVCFRPGSVQLRSCDCCGHGWVAHALEKLQAQPPSSCGPVEVALPGVVFDLSSLVLYGAQAIPVRLKILLDRLYSILTPEQVGHILHTLGWNLGDYVRGYMLQFPSGKVLDRWFMVTPEEEVLIFKQFLRFGETRPIVELMLQTADGGRKGRVCCGVCGKSFYDKGTLKIHYNAVHLKIKHRCTVAGCTMVFSSLRSRNRHSANPNPRLHTSSSRDTYSSLHSDHTSHQNQHTNPTFALNNPQVLPPLPPHLHSVHTASSLGSPPSLIPVVSSATDKIKHPRLTNHSSSTTPISQESCDTQRASHYCEGNRWKPESIDPVPKKKPRKSSMPVKIEREMVERRRHENEEEY